MYQRTLLERLRKASQSYPVITLVGPRQSGKTTLARQAFAEYAYVSLEDPDIRLIASEDPRALLKRYSGDVIFDEVQRVPELTSYLQSIVDDPANSRRFCLTGSHNLLLIEAVSQSLAGRTRVFDLLPLSVLELAKADELPELNTLMWRGGYPAIYQRKLDAHEWLRDYFRLYVERDLRQVTRLSNLDTFERFIRLVAGRVGQLVNFEALGNETGISQPTAKSWLSALKTSFVVFSLQPHYRNFSRRIVKTPKLYFHDTGLLCFLLGIREPEQLNIHPLRGQIFENFIVSEFIKKAHHRGESPKLYFWRDHKGHEVDIVEDRSWELFPIEIKFASTFRKQMLKGLDYFNKLREAEQAASASHPKEIAHLAKKTRGQVICDVDTNLHFHDYAIESWKILAEDL